MTPNSLASVAIVFGLEMERASMRMSIAALAGPAPVSHKNRKLWRSPFDVNADGQRDPVAGNDFATPDQSWERRGAT